MALKLFLDPFREVSSIVSLCGNNSPAMNRSEAFHPEFVGIGIRLGLFIGGCFMVLRK